MGNTIIITVKPKDMFALAPRSGGYAVVVCACDPEGFRHI